jgi:P27 family predicted phage terminase small subunit
MNQNEPQFTGTPKCPSDLPAPAKVEWRRVVKEMEALEMLRSVDMAALAAYCEAYANWRTAEEIVRTEGQIIHEPILSKAGEVVGEKVKRHPATTIAREERAAMVKIAALFGFDPSSRSRLSVPAQKPQTLNDILDNDDDHDPAFIQ